MYIDEPLTFSPWWAPLAPNRKLEYRTDLHRSFAEKWGRTFHSTVLFIPLRRNNELFGKELSKIATKKSAAHPVAPPTCGLPLPILIGVGWPPADGGMAGWGWSTTHLIHGVQKELLIRNREVICLPRLDTCKLDWTSANRTVQNSRSYHMIKKYWINL